MRKQEFLSRLQGQLSGLPREDIAERLTFYGEMIDDRMEEGLTEEEAVAEIGPVEEIVSQTVADIPIAKLVKERVKPKRPLPLWAIVLLVLGSPIWLSLLIAALAVAFSVYVVIWAVILTLWAAEISMIAGAVAAVGAGILLFCRGDGAQGLCMLGGGLVLAGLAIFLFFGCRAAGKGALELTRRMATAIKTRFLRKKENA
ncbi:MAG: DUF1700 domain-containing protein [Firmicutes bacterium]|nr:DUF1700 domain-containing protein [Bacillota bacterium]